MSNQIDTDNLENNDEIRASWEKVRNKLSEDVGLVAFKSWLNHLQLKGFKSPSTIYLSLPSSFLLDWVIPHYGNKITSLWGYFNPNINNVFIIVEKKSGNAFYEKETSKIHSDEFSIEKTSSPLDPRFTFDNFIVGKSNEFAYAAARRLAESPKVSFNPLFLFGGVGLGKTHLMHAIAWEISEKTPKRKVVYLSAEKFMYEFVKSIRFRDTMSFKEKFRSVDVLMVDDVQFIAGKDSTQEEFFHTFNALVDQSKQIVVTGDRSPADLDGIEERLRSRLSFGVVGEIHTTTYELRLSILTAKAEQNHSINVPRKVLEFLANKITSNIRELEGALKRLLAHADLINRTITIDTTRELLHDILRANDKRVTVEEIQRKVADYFNIRLNDMVSVRRSRIVARPRQVAMYLSKQHTSRSLPEIGRMFGGRDHTTVMHAVKRIDQLCQLDSSFAEHIKVLKRSIGS